MSKPLAIVLVAALSGVPAAAVVCDLVLCVTQAAGAAPGCHEHRAPGDTHAISPASRDCTHLAATAPFIAPGAGQAISHVSPLPDIATPQPLSADLSIAPLVRAGPPPAAHRPLTLALRI